MMRRYGWIGLVLALLAAFILGSINMPAVSFRTLMGFDNNFNGTNVEVAVTDDLETVSFTEISPDPTDYRFVLGNGSQIAIFADELRQLYRTTDSGDTWSFISTLTGTSADYPVGGALENGRWYIVSRFGDIWHSDDGQAFTRVDQGSSNASFVEGGGVMANSANNRVVAVAYNGGPAGNFAYKLSTDNGQTWPTNYSSAMAQNINPIAVAFFNNLFLAIGQYVASSAGSSGSSWSTNGVVRNFAAAAVDTDRIVAIDISGNVWHSTDGTTWTDTTWDLGRTLTLHAESTQMFFKGGGLVLIDDAADIISWSTDQGENWSNYPIGTAKAYYPRAGFVSIPAGFQDFWTGFIGCEETPL